MKNFVLISPTKLQKHNIKVVDQEPESKTSKKRNNPFNQTKQRDHETYDVVKT